MSRREGTAPPSVLSTTKNESPNPVQGHQPRFRPDIQGLRAIAVLLVVIFHSGFGFSGGFLGVDVFFVVSGFVIGRLLIHEVVSTDRIGFGDFYSRRVRRILPALAVVLIFVAIGSVVVLAPSSGLQPLTTKVGIASALFSANIALLNLTKSGYFDLSSEWNPLLHMWTLGVEEQFYLVLPLLLFVAYRLARRFGRSPHTPTSSLRWIAGICASLAVASFVAGVVIASSSGAPRHDVAANQQWAFYLLPTRAWEFLAGVSIVFLERSRIRITQGPATAFALGGLGAVMWSGWFVTGASPTPGVIALVPVLGAVAIIAAGTSVLTGVSKVLATRPAAWIGDRSYGWYLWHWPVIVFTRTSFPTAPKWVLLAAGVAALLPTELSYRFVETPIRFNRSWRGRRAVRLALLCCGTSILAFGLAAGAQRLTGGIGLPGNPEQAHLDKELGCARMLPDDPRVKSRCTWQTPGAKGRIVLIGDSHAGALSEVMRQRSTAAGYDFTLVTFDACRFAHVQISTSATRCRRWVDEWTEELAGEPQSLVVVANRASWMVHDPDAPLIDPTTGAPTTDVDRKAEIWAQGTSRTLDALTRSGTPAVVVATVPQFDDFEVRTCAAWRVVFAPESCAVSRPRAAVDAYRAESLPAQRHAVEEHPDAHLVDFTDELCTPFTCPTTKSDMWQYRDGSHLSVPGAMALGPVIDRDVIALAQPLR